MQKSTHFCLIGDENICNITPAISPQMRAREVVLFHGKEHIPSLEALQKVFSRHGIKQTTVYLENIWDIDILKLSFSNFIDQHNASSTVLNLSGGTRPMSLAAFEVFKGRNHPIFYVHHDTDQITWLNPSDKSAMEIPDKIKLNDYLSAYGTTIIEKAQDNQSRQLFKPLTDQLIENIEVFSDSLKIVNGLAYKADENLLSPALTSEQINNKKLREVFNLFAEHKLCSIEQTKIRFTSEEARFFMNGGWLEDHVFNTLISLRSKLRIQDIAQGVFVERITEDGHQVRNELDVAFIANNHFYVVECKTAQMHKKGIHTVYKLDSLSDTLGGIKGKGMLISYMQLNKNDRQRAKDLSIDICQSSDIKSLQKALTKWIK